MNGIISKLFCTFRLPTDRNACSSLLSRVSNSNPFHLNENTQGALWISNTWHDCHWIVARNKQPLYQWNGYSALAYQHGSTSIIRKKITWHLVFLTIKPSHIAWRPLLLKDTEVFLSITALIQITYQLWNLWSIPNMKYYSSFKRNEWNIYISSPHDKRYFKNVISYNHLNMMLWTGRRKWKNTYQIVKINGLVESVSGDGRIGRNAQRKCSREKRKEEKYFTLKHIKYTLLIAYVCRKYMFKNHITLLHTQKYIIVNRDIILALYESTAMKQWNML